jgi:hypothetical protein
MINAATSDALIQSPLVVTMVGVACTAMVVLAGAALKLVIQLAKMQSDINAIQKDITEIRTDADIMRWSNYGRATQALIQAPPQQGPTS